MQRHILLPFEIEPPVVEDSQRPRGGKGQTSKVQKSKGQKRFNAGRSSVVRH
jgi:hypothetical protein